MKSRALSKRGIGLIEVVVGVALFTTIFVALFGVLQLGTRLAANNKARTGAVALAIERMEYIRSLEYDEVGTIGGDPVGFLATSEDVSINNVPYTRETYIVYIDDPKDGVGASDTNAITDDYKRVKVSVSWENKNGTRTSTIVTDITPEGVEE